MRITEKGEQTDQPDLAVLLPYPALGRVGRIGPEQYSIIVGPGRQGGRHQVYPPPILGRFLNIPKKASSKSINITNKRKQLYLKKLSY